MLVYMSVIQKVKKNRVFYTVLFNILFSEYENLEIKMVFYFYIYLT